MLASLAEGWRRLCWVDAGWCRLMPVDAGWCRLCCTLYSRLCVAPSNIVAVYKQCKITTNTNCSSVDWPEGSGRQASRAGRRRPWWGYRPRADCPPPRRCSPPDSRSRRAAGWRGGYPRRCCRCCHTAPAAGRLKHRALLIDIYLLIYSQHTNIKCETNDGIVLRKEEKAKVRRFPQFFYYLF